MILISLCSFALFIYLTISAHGSYISLRKLEKQLEHMSRQTECNKIELIRKQKVIETSTVVKAIECNKIELLEKQKVVESLVDKSASAVEDVHLAISDITFNILELIPVTKHTSKIVKDIHDTTSKSVYNIVRLVNKQMSSILLKSH